MTYGPMHVRLPEHGVINLKNTSFRITGAVETGQASTGGSPRQGGNMAGWSLYLDNESRPTYVYNWFGHEFTTIVGTSLGPGEHQICVEYAHMRLCRRRRSGAVRGQATCCHGPH